MGACCMASIKHFARQGCASLPVPCAQPIMACMDWLLLSDMLIAPAAAALIHSLGPPLAASAPANSVMSPSVSHVGSGFCRACLDVALQHVLQRFRETFGDAFAQTELRARAQRTLQDFMAPYHKHVLQPLLECWQVAHCQSAHDRMQDPEDLVNLAV